MYVKDTTLILKVFNQQPVGNLLAYILADDEPHTYPVKLVVFPSHDHRMLAEPTVKAYKPKETEDADLYRLFFEVEASADIVHERSFDTHETLRVSQSRSGGYEGFPFSFLFILCVC